MAASNLPRAVVDTNVVVSALIRPDRAPGQVLRRLLDGDFVLVLSPPIVEELRATLRRPLLRKYLRFSSKEIDHLLVHFETLADPVVGTLDLNVELRDPDDMKFLAAAVEGMADYVVTGDGDLLAVGEHNGMAVVTPRIFLDLLA